MSTPLMPELPEPQWCMPERMAGEWKIPGAWSSDQLRAYGLAVWKAAMQHAVEVAKKHASQGPFTGNYGMGYNDASHIIADTLAGLPLPESDMTQARGE